MNYQYIGKSTPVNNSRAKASGLLRYAGDMKLPNMLHMKLVLSPVSHGIVKAIDASAALATPGVAAVLSFENTPDTKYNRGRVRAREDAVDQETFFSRHVRFVGDRVAAVLADTPEIAAAAAEKIKLEIEELPAVFTVEDAARERLGREIRRGAGRGVHPQHADAAHHAHRHGNALRRGRL